MQTPAEEIKTLKKLGKKYNVPIPVLDAEYAQPPDDVIAEITAAIDALGDAQIEEAWELEGGYLWIKIMVDMSWNVNYGDVGFKLLAVKTNLPKLFTDILRDAIENAEQMYSPVWEKIVAILKRRQDVKQFKAKVKKLATKLAKLEQQYPGFDSDAYFDLYYFDGW